MGVSEQTFYTWKRKYKGIGVSDLRELRQLRDENRRLKMLVADLILDKHILHLRHLPLHNRCKHVLQYSLVVLCRGERW